MADTEERARKRTERRLKRKEKLAEGSDVNGEPEFPLRFYSVETRIPPRLQGSFLAHVPFSFN